MEVQSKSLKSALGLMNEYRSSSTAWTIPGITSIRINVGSLNPKLPVIQLTSIKVEARANLILTGRIPKSPKVRAFSLARPGVSAYWLEFLLAS